MNQRDIEEHRKSLIDVGAVGRNAIVCKCGHIEYIPNGKYELFPGSGECPISDCAFYVDSCMECREGPTGDNIP